MFETNRNKNKKVNCNRQATFTYYDALLGGLSDRLNIEPYIMSKILRKTLSEANMNEKHKLNTCISATHYLLTRSMISELDPVQLADATGIHKQIWYNLDKQAEVYNGKF